MYTDSERESERALKLPTLLQGRRRSLIYKSFKQFRSSSMDSAFMDKAWDKWVSTGNVGSSGNPLKAAVLINYDPTGPSRLLSTIAEQEGIDLYPVELKQFIDFMRRGNLPTETFVLGSNQYIVTSLHENWFAARCLNTTQPAGEGAVVIQTAAHILVALYDGSIGSASQAMASADHFVSFLSRKNF